MRGSSSPSSRNSAAHDRYLLLLLCVCSFAAFAAGCASAAASKDSPARLSFAPAVVDFKTVVVGQKNSQTVTVSNISTTPVDLKSVKVSGAGFQLASAKLPASLAPGAKANLSVSFAPASAASVNGTLILFSPDTWLPLSVSLSGTGEKAAPALQASATSIGFGTRATGSSNFQTVSLRNTGNINLKIQSISVASSVFSVSGFTPGVSLAVDQQLSFQVWFRPVSSGSWSTSISVVASSISSPVELALSGAASTNTAPAPSATPHAVALDWSASTSTVDGYHVYRGESTGGPYNRVNSSLVTSLGYSDPTVQSGARYFYVVTAVQSDGDESTFSNEVSADIPN
jgi:hypothetical protein